MLSVGTGFDPQTDPAGRNAVLRYLSRLSPGSRRTQQMALNRIAAVMTDGAAGAEETQWHLLDAEQTAAIRDALCAEYAPTTTNRMLAALRGVLQEAFRLGLMDAETYHRASALENVSGSVPSRGRMLGDEEIRRLFAVCMDDSTPAGVRDAALITVLYAGGLRRSEVVALDLRDYDPASGALAIRAVPGSRERTVYAQDGAAETLNRWIAVRGSTSGPLFVPINKGAKILVGTRRMNDQSIYRVLVKRGKQAGVAAFTAQDLRRTFITRLLESGADISTVQRLAGHANVTTTQRYDRRTRAVQREHARMLAVPLPTTG